MQGLYRLRARSVNLLGVLPFRSPSLRATSAMVVAPLAAPRTCSVVIVAFVVAMSSPPFNDDGMEDAADLPLVQAKTEWRGKNWWQLRPWWEGV